MPTGRSEYAAFAVAALAFLIVLLVSYFCLELRGAYVRADGFRGRMWTTGPLPDIEPPACPCDAAGARRGACNCCSASIVPP